MSLLNPQSFRGRLAIRFGAALCVVALVGSTIGYLALRTFLYQRLDGIVAQLANIEAAATADSPDDQVHFHDEVFLGSGPGFEALLTRYAQVWSTQGVPLLRSLNLGEVDLPLPGEILAEVVRTRTPQLFGLRWNGSGYRGVLYPLGLVDARHGDHLLQVVVSTAETDGLLRRSLVFLLGLIVVGVSVGGGLAWWLAGYATRPVLDIIQQAETLEGAHPGHRIVVAADTAELRRLITVLNSLFGRIDAALDAQRQFLADAGHAIKTPLTILRGDVDVALRRPRSPEEYRRVLEQALEDLRLISSLAEDLITLARSDSGAATRKPTAIAVPPLLARLQRKFEGAATRAGVELVADDAGDVQVTGDAVLLERALGNLVDNAVKYGSRPGGRILLSARADADGRVALGVTDDGAGIAEADLPFVRDRFFRADATRTRVPGTGLGLAIVSAITSQMGGTLELTSVTGQGTFAAVLLPGGPAPPVDQESER